MKKKKIIILSIAAILLAVIIGIAIQAISYTNKAEEMWEFRDTLDETYFPLQGIAITCLFEVELEEEYSCKLSDALKELERSKLIISSYDVRYEDTKELKREVIRNITVIEKLLDLSKELDPENEETFLSTSIEILENKEQFINSKEKIIDIINEYYH